MSQLKKQAMCRLARFLAIATGIVLAFFVVAVLLVTNPVFGAPRKKNIVGVSATQLRAHVDSLCSTPGPRNSDNLIGLNAAADYILRNFKQYSEHIEEQKCRAGWTDYRNIICSFGPMDAERLIVGAHYDVFTNPGADDNASGVAGLLELARLLDTLKPNLKYRVDLVAYTNEEPPYFRTEQMGSAVHAKYLHDNKINVKGMICLEMIGYFTDEEKSQSYPLDILHLFYPEKGNFVAVVGQLWQRKIVRKVKSGMLAGSEISVKSINSPKWVVGIDFSDHLNYWKYGYDAIMITDTSWYRNDQYHETGDTPDCLDYERMAQVVSGIYNAMVNY
jgi:hypothetical protein